MHNPADDYMKVYAQTLMDDKTEAEYGGRWKSIKRRFKIFKKPREYKFTVHLVNALGDKDITTIDPKVKINKTELSGLIHFYLNQLIQDNKEQGINTKETYIVVRAKYK